MFHSVFLSLLSHLTLLAILITISYTENASDYEKSKPAFISIELFKKKSNNNLIQKRSTNSVVKKKLVKNYQKNTQQVLSNPKNNDFKAQEPASEVPLDSPNAQLTKRMLPVLIIDDTIAVPYPKKAKYHMIEGVVRLLLTVSAKGHVIGAHVLSGPDFGLKEAALIVAHKLKFLPATNDKGEAEISQIEHTVVFKLAKAS